MIDEADFSSALDEFVATFKAVMSMPFPWIKGMTVGEVLLGVLIVAMLLRIAMAVMD